MQDSAATSCAVRPPLSSLVNLRRTHRGCRSREARERRLHLHRGLSRAFFHDEDYYDEHCSAVSTSDYDHADRFFPDILQMETSTAVKALVMDLFVFPVALRTEKTSTMIIRPSVAAMDSPRVRRVLIFTRIFRFFI